jgi:ABC-type metal ion transport system substrate-binding protein
MNPPEKTLLESEQDYLNWIVFRSMLNSEKINEKIEELVERCFQNKVVYRIKDRYYRKKVSTFL